LTNAAWRGKVAMAYPLFGSTATHFLALRAHWGVANWLDWCRALEANAPIVVDGNSIVARLVAEGRAAVGLTDSDDFMVVRRESAPVAMLDLDEESLLIPNTVAVLRGAPHPVAADRLYRFIGAEETANQLVSAGALESAESPAERATVLRPEWPAILQELETATEQLRAVFLR
jgi:iron(III) transport system substrate-binding protein